MKYKIRLANGKAQIIKISSAYFKSWHVWNIQFEDGKVAMLFKLGGEWMQRNEDFLDAQLINILGSSIDKIMSARKIAW